MNLFLLFLIILFQFNFNNRDNVDTKKINNALTSEHENIKGTKVSMIKPIDFSEASNFYGFQHTESGSSIMVVNFLAPFSFVSQGFTSDKLKEKGVEVINQQVITVNGLSGLFLKTQQKMYGKVYIKYVLTFGTKTETYIMNGTFPKDYKKIGVKIKAALMSTVYEGEKTNNPFETLDFEINVSNSKLIYADNIANNLMFNVDGNIPTKSSDNTYLLVGKSFSELKISHQLDFCEKRLYQYPLKIVDIEKKEKIKINNLYGYEIIAIGSKNKSGENIKMIQTILFSENIYYILVGVTNNDVDKNIDELREVIKTFKRK